MNIEALFVLASRKAFRFETKRHTGMTIEELWNLPLKAADERNADLNQVAVAIDEQLRTATANFVDDATPSDETLTQKFEIVKHIIATRKAEDAAAKNRAQLSAERRELLNLRAEKRAEALKGLSEEQINARLAEIDAETQAA